MLCIWLAASLALAPPPPASSARAARSADDGVARALAVFELWLEDKQQREVIPSISVAVVHDQDLLWAKSLGYADVERRVRATPRTPYRIASLTKTFTATALLQLRDEGKLQLDDPVRKHLAWFAPATKERPDITIRHLLTHASGLSRDVPGDFWDTMRFDEASRLAVLVELSETPFGAGERFKYSNVGYAVAGEIVAAAAGKPWADVVTTRVLSPLGMTTTWAPASGAAASGAAATATVPADTAVPYGPLDENGQRPVLPIGAPGWFAAAGGMTSSAEDLARWLSFQMRDRPVNVSGPVAERDVLARATIKEMQRAQVVRNDWKGGWGLGWGVVPVEKDTPRVLHAGGSDRGFRSLVTFDPVKRVGFVVLTNSDAAPRDVAEQLWKIVAPAIVKAKAPPIDKARAAKLVKFAGRYVKTYATAEPLLVVVDGDRLAMVEGDAEDPWLDRALLRDVTIDTKSAKFRIESGDADGDTLTFELDAKGNVTRVVGFGWSARKVPD
jgi:CubicO group peptidase (beta-lactamase class C family)